MLSNYSFEKYFFVQTALRKCLCNWICKNILKFLQENACISFTVVSEHFYFILPKLW